MSAVALGGDSAPLAPIATRRLADHVGRAGLSLRQAAVIAGVTYLTNPISLAEFGIWPRLIVGDDLDRTVRNLTDHPALFVTAILCYLLSFLGDVVMAWALYALLAPVHKGLSLLASGLQLVFAAMALTGIFNLLTVHNLLRSPAYLEAFGSMQLRAQVLLHLRSFHNDFDLSLTVFGLHLLVVSYLLARSNYIPRFLAIPIAAAGLSWIINFVGPYYWPHQNFEFTTVMAAGELIFMAWLLFRGWKIKEPLLSHVEEAGL